MRAPFLALLLVASALAGCAAQEDARARLVPYPKTGDVATYEATGALVEFSRWNNAVPFAAASAQVRLSIADGPTALDAARALHPTFRLTTEVAEAGVFGKRSERFVSPAHQGVVQGFYVLSQDQSVLSFDERGFPWLFGASPLFGAELAPGARIDVPLPDNLGRGKTFALAWEVVGEEDGLTRLDLTGAGANGTLWMRPGSAWPERVALEITPALAPHVRSDGGYPARIEARLTSLAEGRAPLPPRDRGADFAEDLLAERLPWDGEKPSDGAVPPFPYALADAVRDAKLLDRDLAAWLEAADKPILYRATYQNESGPVEGTTSDLWLLQFVDRSASYYETQISRLAPSGGALPVAPPAPLGVPRVESSGPAEPPSDTNHGWFDPASVPETIVPLSEAVRIVQEVFGAPQVQLFLRSFADPPGYSYFVDGGFEVDKRYTVVYNPNTALLEQATGPVSPRVS